MLKQLSQIAGYKKLSSGIWIPGCSFLAFSLPGCCCAGVCDYCTGTSPDQIAVTFSGITNDSCVDCGNLNDTFILDRSSPSALCSWYLDISGNGWCTAGTCLLYDISVGYGPPGLSVRINYYGIDCIDTGFLLWLLSGTSHPCGGSNNVPFSLRSGLIPCSGVSSTCTMEAV